MLVLSRKQDQEILIGDNIKITVLKSKGNTVRLGIEAPRDIKVVRGELQDSPANPSQSNVPSQAGFTVVYDDQPTTSNSHAVGQGQPATRTFDVVSYPDHKQTSNTQRSAKRPTINRLDGFTRSEETTPQPSPSGETVRFRGQLPQVLQHNRLKEIVAQISNDAK